MSNFDKLCKVLFEGDVKVVNIHMFPGTEVSDKETLSKALLDSMERVGLVKNSVLVRP